MATSLSILSTRPVKQILAEEAATRGIQLQFVSLIDTEPILDIDVQQEIEQIALQNATVVFTSMNAAEFVITMLDHQIPDWNIYCMGNTTVQIIQGYFGKQAIAGTANSASDLADVIIEADETDEIFFFCGDQRRDELPGKLTQAGIHVHEVIVYRTIPMYKRIEQEYQAILFFSPSAVHSYFKLNKITGHTVLFAIGPTTATAIKQYSNNKTITANIPGKDELVRMAITYLSEVRET